MLGGIAGRGMYPEFDRDKVMSFKFRMPSVTKITSCIKIMLEVAR